MKYFKIIFFLFVVSLSGTTWAYVFPNQEDCSEVVDGIFIQKTCTTKTIKTETEIARYAIDGLPATLETKLKLRHLNEAGSSGKPVVFYQEPSITNSIFPPKEENIFWQISFDGEMFTVKKVIRPGINLMSMGIIFILVILSLISGLSSTSDLNPRQRQATQGAIYGMAIGLLVFTIINMTQEIITVGGVNFFVVLITVAGILALIYISSFIAPVVAVMLMALGYIGKPGLVLPDIIEWSTFCFVLIALEYIIVIARRHPFFNKNSTSVSN